MLCCLNPRILRVVKKVSVMTRVAFQIFGLCAMRSTALNPIQREICRDSDSSKRDALVTKGHIECRTRLLICFLHSFSKNCNTTRLLLSLGHPLSSAHEFSGSEVDSAAAQTQLRCIRIA